MKENQVKTKSTAAKIGAFLVDNIAMLIFIVFVIWGLLVAKELTFFGYLNNLIDRFFRNGILVLSLIIPVIAGLGLNFGIVVGAMSGQLALVIVSYYGIGNLGGLLLTMLIATPIAVLFGWLTGILYNKTRGQEMIASLIVGYFGNGIYQLILLFLVGTLIPVAMDNPLIMPNTGIGVRMSVDLGSMKYSLDSIFHIPFMYVVLITAAAFLLYFIIRMMRGKNRKTAAQTAAWKQWLGLGICAALVVFSAICIVTNNAWMTVKDVPLFTLLPILLVCLFTWWIMRTKLGQDFRSVGQNQHIAESNGINVDRTRIIATIISTVLGAWGIIIYLQNMGTLNTYTTHMQIGIFSVAAILVGGATVAKAGISNAMIGVVLFHSMMVMSTEVGKSVFGSVALGEYFRTTLVYGVIAISLGLYAIKINRDKKITLHGATSKLPKNGLNGNREKPSA